jgi:hypothetical protein
MQLHRDRDKFDQAGANLVVIGQGTPEQGVHFLASQHVDLPLLVDRERRSYKAAGTKIATLTELVGPRVVLKGALTGHRQGKTVGHNAQLGGVLVIATDGSVSWAHMSDDASDIPANDDVLEAVGQAG